MDELLNAAFEISKTLFDGADQKILDVINGEDSRDVYLTVPDVFITLFERAFYVSEVFNFATKQMDALQWLGRVNIFSSVDWAITLYHKDYSHTKEKWMIRKMPITNTIKINDGIFSKELIELNELIFLSQERVALN